MRPGAKGSSSPPSAGARRAAAGLAAAALLLAAAAPPARDAGEGERARMVAAARRHVGRAFAGDCSSFLLALLAEAGVRVALAPARSRSESLYLASLRVSAARPGDLAFFHDTYDRNRDGRPNDAYTHVALVEAVAGSAVVLVHRGARGIERVRMDLSRPDDPAANDPVRSARPADPAGTPRLAGELFAGFGALTAP